MACEATARLYDVDEDSVVFEKLDRTQKYDQGTITFRARKGMLIDLGKLHESIRATRLSGGTRSGLVSLVVTAIGQVVLTEDETTLRVSGSDSQFVLRKHPDDKHAAAFEKLQAAAGGSKVIRVTGQIDDYMGRWPDVLSKQPETPRRILVSHIEVTESL